MQSTSAIPLKTATPAAIHEGAAESGKEPGLFTLLFIFWGALAAAIAIANVFNPDMFVRQDPDSLMRLVQVRDLLAGQGWFDLMQYRIDPPDGSLMHWSRVIDAPVAALVLFGNLFGAGEAFALAAWPLILLFGLMAGVMLSATALAGRRAAAPALILSMFFLDPMLFFLPGDIDHHNAQYALLALLIAAALRLEARPALAAALGAGAALMLAIGLEMLPYVALIGAYVAAAWAFGAQPRRAAALFGLSFAVSPAALYLLTGSPEAAFACDALSWSLALPAVVAGLGLAAFAAALPDRSGLVIRATGLAVVGAATLATLMLLAPGCLTGPYGQLSPELKTLFLETVTEAQPIWEYAARQPEAAITTLGPPAVALAVAFCRVWSGPRRTAWALPLVVLAAAIALGFYQVRTLPYANVAAIAVLGAWVAELAARHGVTSLRPIRAAVPVFVGFLVACPLAHLALGAAVVSAASAVTGGRIGAAETPKAPKELTDGLTSAELECLDPASGALLANVPRGEVLAPVFYGPAVLMLSQHSVVAGPYHRAGRAILDTIHATYGTPGEARAIVDARGVGYVAACLTSRESAVVAKRAPDGLLARLLAGDAPAWLEPVPAPAETALRLWRVKDDVRASIAAGVGGFRGTKP